MASLKLHSRFKVWPTSQDIIKSNDNMSFSIIFSVQQEEVGGHSMASMACLNNIIIISSLHQAATDWAGLVKRPLGRRR